LAQGVSTQEFFVKRFLALDALRGFTVAAMILVNTPGSWSHIYAPLQHAQWHGWTPTDFIFPFFLFITGSAMAFSLGKQSLAPSTALILRIVKRGVLIFLIGLFLNAFPFQNDLSDLRIMGVLQRIGIVYIFAALIVIFYGRVGIALISAGILLIYWYLLLVFGGLELEGNLVRQVDLAVLGANHMWSMGGVAFEPEGLLSTLPAIVNALAGYEVTRFLRAQNSFQSGMKRLYLCGALVLGIALLWGEVLPINKSLWTPSYVLFSTGIAMLTLATFIWIVDVKKVSWFSKPCEVFGLNPLFIYALSWLWVVCYAAFIQIDNGLGGSINGYDALFSVFQSVLSPVNASLAFAVVHVLLFWAIAHVLYRRNIIIKI